MRYNPSRGEKHMLTDEDKRFRKMIKGLQCCDFENEDYKCENCPYDGVKFCKKTLRNDVLLFVYNQMPKKKEALHNEKG